MHDMKNMDKKQRSVKEANEGNQVPSLGELVYAYLRTIPDGRVVTYGQIAARIGRPKAARAVGTILHRNPDGDRIPCYKVVNRDGRLSPHYAFGGMAAQRERLEREGIAVIGDKVDLARYGYPDEDG